MNTFHLTVYDGNQREWSRSTVETEHGDFTLTALDHLCGLNKHNFDCPTGPVKYLVDDHYSAIRSIWTLGREVWSLIIIVSRAKLGEIETSSIVKKLDVDLTDQDEE